MHCESLFLAARAWAIVNVVSWWRGDEETRAGAELVSCCCCTLVVASWVVARARDFLPADTGRGWSCGACDGGGRLHLVVCWWI